MNIIKTKAMKEFYGENVDKALVYINAALNWYQAHTDAPDPDFVTVGSDPNFILADADTCIMQDDVIALTDRFNFYASPREIAEFILAANVIRRLGADEFYARLKSERLTYTVDRVLGG